MNERFRALVYGTVFAVVVGWVLYIGRDVLIPIVFSVMIMYVIVGSVRQLERIPRVGPRLPVQLRYGISALVMLCALVMLGWLAMDSIDAIVAQGPHYQSQLVSLAQKAATLLGLESEPSWESLRRSVLEQVNLQRLAGSLLLSAGALLGGLTGVALYVVFLMIERGQFDAKVDAISDDPERGAQIRRIVTDINGRVSTYLALKTMLSVLVGLICWIILRAMGVELAGFWALVIGLLNYVPYIGSVLGVAVPALFALLQFGDLKSALLLTGMLSVVQFLNGFVLDPWLMGSSLNLSPFVILVSLTVWTALWGIPGAFLAVPLTASLLMVLAEFKATRPITVLLSNDGKV